MDEIDGMSTGDKGGIAELCRIIPKTKVLFILQLLLAFIIFIILSFTINTL
jgi:hypothetical protein